jgi:hypothetical protein
VPVSSPIHPVVDHLADLALWEAELTGDRPEMAAPLAGRLVGCPTRVIRGAAGTVSW